MKSTKQSVTPITNITDATHARNGESIPDTPWIAGGDQRDATPPDLSDVRATARDHANPVDYRHPPSPRLRRTGPYESMRRL